MTARPTDADFTAVDTVGVDAGSWAAELERIIHDQGAMSRAMVTIGTSPDHHLSYLEFGDSGAHNDIRIGYDGTSFLLQQNTGTEGTPVWTTRLTANATSGAITGTGDVTLGGNLNADGGNFTNLGTLNGVTITSLASRLVPGGADALTTAAASKITGANAEGSAAAFARADHDHDYTPVKKTGSANISGQVTLSEGSGITLTQAASDIEIASSSGAVNDTWDKKTAGDQTGLAATKTPITWDASDTGDGHLFPGAEGTKDYYVDVLMPYIMITSAINFSVRLHVGTTGDETDTEVFRLNVEQTSNNVDEHIRLGPIKVENPGATDLLTVSVQRNAGSGTLTVRGDTLSNVFSTIRIWEIK